MNDGYPYLVPSGCFVLYLERDNVGGELHVFNHVVLDDEEEVDPAGVREEGHPFLHFFAFSGNLYDFVLVCGNNSTRVLVCSCLANLLCIEILHHRSSVC